MKTDPTLDTEAALFEAELARVRGENVAGRAVQETLARPELQKQLEELTADAPPGATGPFLRKAGALAARDDAFPSERAEEVVTEGRNTNPVPKDPGPKARVLVGARKPGDSAAITAPSIARMAEVAAEAPAIVGRTPGNTLKLKRVDAASAEASAPAEPASSSTSCASPSLEPLPPPPKQPRQWKKALPVVAILGGMAVALVVMAINAAPARMSDPTGAPTGPARALKGEGATANGTTDPRADVSTVTAAATAVALSVRAVRSADLATHSTSTVVREEGGPRKATSPTVSETLPTLAVPPEPPSQTPPASTESRPAAVTAAAPAGVPTW